MALGTENKKRQDGESPDEPSGGLLRHLVEPLIMVALFVAVIMTTVVNPPPAKEPRREEAPTVTADPVESAVSGIEAAPAPAAKPLVEATATITSGPGGMVRP